MGTDLFKLNHRIASGTSNIDMSIALTTDPSGAPDLAMELWFYSNDGAEPFLVTNPTLELRVYRRMGPSSRSAEARRLPVTIGGFNDTGGLASGKAVVWRPFVRMTTEEVLALDHLRHEEHGLHVEFQMQATALRFFVTGGHSRGPSFVAPEALVWHAGFDLTNDQWRTLLASWGWPRPRVFELHPASFASLEDFDIAVKAVAAAERQILLGHWAEAIGHARKVVEGVLRHLGYKTKNSMDWQAMKVEGFPAEMSDLIKAFNSVTSLEHHATGSDHAWERADARFLLHLAVAIAEYAGTLPPRRAPPT